MINFIIYEDDQYYRDLYISIILNIIGKSKYAYKIIEIDKYGDDNNNPYGGKGSSDNKKSETVDVKDTLKISYIGYIIGLFILIIGAYIVYKSVKDSEVNIEE